MAVAPEQAVDAAQGAFGHHAGFRALHARGILCSGRFVASGAGAEFSTAAFLSGDPIPATFRFSNGSGDPQLPDFAPDLRGMAVKLYLHDDTRTDIVAVNMPVFASPTPEGFVDLLRAQAGGPSAALKLPTVIARHPRLLRALPHLVGAMRPVASYAQVTFYGQHAFRWVDAGGGVRHVRYTLRPAAGEGRISLAAARRAGREYLQDELRARLTGGGVVRFALEVQVAQPGDPVDDPSRAWPPSRQRVTAGHFEVTGLETAREKGDDVLVFDPTRVVAGIELSDDPVLRFRSPAYRESVKRRTAQHG